MANQVADRTILVRMIQLLVVGALTVGIIIANLGLQGFYDELSHGPQRVQVAGSRVTLVPLRGLDSVPGASVFVRKSDGLSVIIEPAQPGQFEQTVEVFRSLEWQKNTGLSEVSVAVRYRLATARAFLQANGQEASGAFRKQMLLIDDGKSAVLVMAAVTKKEFDANPKLTDAIEQMFELVTFADHESASPFSFQITPPRDYLPMGQRGGQMQVFAHGDVEFFTAVRVAKPATPSELPAKAKRVFTVALRNHFSNLQTTTQLQAHSGSWDFYEEEFKGTSQKLGVLFDGIQRIQTNSNNETYLLSAAAVSPASDQWRASMRTAFESIRTQQ